MTNFELAQTLVRLGAVRGMALDGGGSSTLAFDGTRAQPPSDGRRARRSDGAHARSTTASTRRRRSSRSSRRTATGSPRRSSSRTRSSGPRTSPATLTAPDGTIALRRTVQPPSRGRYDVAFPPAPAPPPDGVPPTPTEPLAACRGALGAQRDRDRRQGLHLDDDAPLRGQLHARLPRRHAGTVAVRRPEGTRDDPLDAGAAARVKVTVETPEGVVVRTVAKRRLPAGEQTRRLGRPRREPQAVAGGRYVVRVAARRTSSGSSRSTQAITVRRVAALARLAT